MRADALVARHMADVARMLDACGATDEERRIVADFIVLRLAERELERAADAFFEAADRLAFARADLVRRVDEFTAALRARAVARADTVPATAGETNSIDW